MAKSKLTDELQEEFCQIIAGGNTITTACGICGISTECYYNWLRQAADGSERHVVFSDDVKRAKAEAKLVRVGRINAAGEAGVWQADAWYLERMHPDEYSLKHILEHTGPGGGPVKAEVKQIDGDDKLGQVLDILVGTGALEPEVADGATAEDDEVHSAHPDA